MRTLCLISTLAGAVVLTGGGHALAAFPGANGQIAFESQRGCPAWTACPATNLFTIEPDGTAEAKFLPELAHDAAWSPDGTKIAFSARGSSSYYIAIANADGTDRRALTPDSVLGNGAEPAWSPDGKKIAFVRFVPDEGFFGLSEIFAMDADGGNPTRLTHSDPYAGTFGAHEPAWSPDGSRIAFTWTVSSPNVITDEEIFVMNADGSDPVRLTHNDTSWVGATDSSPTWSPDGRRIAFHSIREGDSDLYTMNPDGTGVSAVPVGPGPHLHPAWSPDGTKIAVAGRACCPGYEIVVYEVDGSGETRLTHGAPSSSFWPDWQPLNRPPDCSSVSASPSSLRPPNHKLVTVSLTGAVDPDGDAVTITVTGVTADEPSSGDFAFGPEGNQVRLRAERDGRGDGRIYTIAFESSDSRGGKCDGTAAVAVPHDR